MPAWLTGFDPKPTLLSKREGSTPLGRFDAAVGPSAPMSVIRLCALAVLPLYLGVAAALWTVLSGGSQLAVVPWPTVTLAPVTALAVAVPGEERTPVSPVEIAMYGTDQGSICRP